MTEIDVGERHFRIGRLNAFDQLHVFRRVMPLLRPVAEELKRNAKADMLDATMAMTGVLSEIPDERLNYVLYKCLAVTYLRQESGYAAVVVNNTLMFQDLDMPALMRLTIAVITENFQDFFAGLLAVKPAQEAIETAMNG